MFCFFLSTVVVGCIWRLLLCLKPLWEEHGGHQGPHVKDETHPARCHLDPEHRPAAFQQALDPSTVVTADKHRLHTNQLTPKN